VLWGFYAIVTKVGDVYEITLTSEVRRVMAYFHFAVSFGLGSSTSLLTCLGLHGFFVRLLFWLFAPLALCLVCIVGALVHLVYERRYSHTALLENALPLVLVALFVMYPLVANAAFEAFSCCARRVAILVHNAPTDCLFLLCADTFDDGTRFLIADVSVSCDTQEHTEIIILAWAELIVYAFGQIVFFGALLFCARKAILSQKPTGLSKAIAFLWREYEPWAYWWELCEMTRRLCRA
jgi:hypothetical protein